MLPSFQLRRWRRRIPSITTRRKKRKECQPSPIHRIATQAPELAKSSVSKAGEDTTGATTKTTWRRRNTKNSTKTKRSPKSSRSPKSRRWRKSPPKLLPSTMKARATKLRRFSKLSKRQSPRGRSTRTNWRKRSWKSWKPRKTRGGKTPRKGSNKSPRQTRIRNPKKSTSLIIWVNFKFKFRFPICHR